MALETKPDLFNRLHEAGQNGQGLQLSPADVELLQTLIQSADVDWENEIETWWGRFEDYDRTTRRGTPAAS